MKNENQYMDTPVFTGLVARASEDRDIEALESLLLRSAQWAGACNVDEYSKSVHAMNARLIRSVINLLNEA